MARIVPYNPFAFPPSMAVRCTGTAFHSYRTQPHNYLQAKKKPLTLIASRALNKSLAVLAMDGLMSREHRDVRSDVLLSYIGRTLP